MGVEGRSPSIEVVLAPFLFFSVNVYTVHGAEMSGEEHVSEGRVLVLSIHRGLLSIVFLDLLLLAGYLGEGHHLTVATS